MIRRLTPKYKQHAKNYSYFQANARLFGLVDTKKEQQRNAIAVHGTSCMYFQKILHGNTCTCRSKKTSNKLVLDDGTSIIDSVSPESLNSVNGSTIDIDFRDSLFNTPDYADELIEDVNNESVEIDLGDDDVNGTTLFSKSLFSDSIDCGLCYRSGHIPGYVPLGHSRYIFHTHNTVDMVGYTTNYSTYPTSFSLMADGGFIQFNLSVPIIFKDVSYGVFNNTQILDVDIFDESGQPITLEYLTENSGNTIIFQVENIGTFTHVVFQFRLVDKPILIDFPQNQRSLDVSMFDSVGNVQLVTSDTIPIVGSGDVIVNLESGNLWRVTDYEYFRMNTHDVLGWNITARIIQLDETLIKINKLFGIN